MSTTCFQDTLFIPNVLWKYESTLVYQSPVAMTFQDDLGVIHDSQSMTCNWNKHWGPSTTLKNCVCKSVISIYLYFTHVLRYFVQVIIALWLYIFVCGIIL
jgi:hypothetical protein